MEFCSKSLVCGCLLLFTAAQLLVYYLTILDYDAVFLAKYLMFNNGKELPRTPKVPLKIILLWKGGSSFSATSNVSNSRACGYCEVTRKRRKLAYNDTAAVLFGYRTKTKGLPLINKRRASQLYIWWTLESPSMTKLMGKRENNKLSDIPDYYFNGTLTLRRDSTFYTMAKSFNAIYRAVEVVKSGRLGVTSNLTELLAKKDRTAVWFVSNCQRGSNAKRRLRLAEKLIEHGLAVDRFGGCFEGEAKRGDRLGFVRTVERYRFYLAFENSFHCPDYITEKFFFNGLMIGAVPIAFGASREDYSAIAPPHSYIHVEDFNTARELVDYLRYLERNTSAYAEYFAWRGLDADQVYPRGRYMGFCALCRSLFGIALNDTRTFEEIYGRYGENYTASVGFHFDRPQRVKSISDWWYGKAGDGCLEES